MVSKCANPDCLMPFLYFGKGTLFLFEISSDPEPKGRNDSVITAQNGPRKTETFWLCGHCSSRFVIRMIRGKAEIIPRDVAGKVTQTQETEASCALHAGGRF